MLIILISIKYRVFSVLPVGADAVNIFTYLDMINIFTSEDGCFTQQRKPGILSIPLAKLVDKRRLCW